MWRLDGGDRRRIRGGAYWKLNFELLERERKNSNGSSCREREKVRSSEFLKRERERVMLRERESYGGVNVGVPRVLAVTRTPDLSLLA